MKKLSNSELTTFCSQFSMILHAGISSIEGLSIMMEDAPQGEGREILEQILLKTEETGSLSSALDSAEVFPPYLCRMTEIGEQSGRLDEVMDLLSQHYRREELLSHSIKSAVTYPLIMLGMMIVILLVLVVKVLPVFNQVYQQLGAELTGISGTILHFGQILGSCSIAFTWLLLMLALAFFYFACTQKGRAKISGFSSRFFLTKRLSEKTACARFASGMYLSLSSGLDVDQSLEMVSRLVDHPFVSSKIQQIRQRLLEGASFADAAEETEIFSGLYLPMLRVGFRTGNVDEIMHQISLQYDEEIEEQLERLLSKAEPALVGILSVAVGMILLSVMLPLMGMMSSIG